MEESKFIRFRFKSALFFLTFAVVCNLLCTPLLLAMGLSKQLAMFLTNSIAGSIGVAIVVLVLEGRYKGRMHALRFCLGTAVIVFASCYYLVYLG